MATRKGKAPNAGRVVGAGKAMDEFPPPSKQPASAAGIFKQKTKAVKKPVAPAILHQSGIQKPARAKPGSSSSPSKVAKSSGRKQDDLHSLAVAFNDTTQAYRDTLYEKTTKRLDDTLGHLLGQLEDLNITTASSPPRTSDPTGSPRKLTLAEKADRTADKLFRRVGSYVIAEDENVQGEDHLSDTTLDNALMDFKAKHDNRFQEVEKLQKKWETVIMEIWKVGVNCLGEDAMSAILLTKPTAPPPSPPPDGVDSLTLDDLDPKPTRKKVKFQEPEPEAQLPRFLRKQSTLSDIAVPARISKEDIQKLEARVEDVGNAQVKALVKIDKESKQSWAKKMQVVLNSLEDE